MSQQIVHVVTTVRRVYGIIEDGSIVRTIPIEAQCQKPTLEELEEAHRMIQEKALELFAEIAEAHLHPHAEEPETAKNGKQRPSRKRTGTEEPAAAG